MNLFEIDQALLDAWDSAIDPETGEILDEDAVARIDELQMERDRKVENIACWIRNLESDAEELKKQKLVFQDRQQRAERKAESLKRYLSAAMQGEKFKSPRVSIGWRKSEQVVFSNEKEFVELMQVSGRDDLLKYTAPTPIKTAVKTALKDGSITTDLAEVVTVNNIQIK